ncbi:hypothetical protein ATE84_0051 [Aquimarina sp. MAR_2010_214]|uniref:DUF6438 domain-containing protein n=1 Tax=Aquimarina sp. MAR_2010_214 TaxID=1250026 RepID=UPI000C714532|nr:DUF6438 domain-containing protein [Aquimarina sp. MAR_2010_214]PKV48065.1 hypothetical protein ATE84_0051 [Aquimarina sp. MAR_2010_214]
MKKNVVGILFLLLIISGCVASKKMNNDQIILKIERTPCLGKCPVYTFEIYDNKTLKYNGVKNVPNQGVRELKLSKKEYTNLISRFEKLPFSRYNTEYGPTNIRDITYVYVTYKGKKVKMTQGSEPKELLNQVREIEKQYKLIE